MKKGKEIPRTHAGKKATEAQDKIISEIRAKMEIEQKEPVTHLEAKHEYFENQEKYDKKALDEMMQTAAEATQEMITAAAPEIEKYITEEKKKRATMTISETKLGITMVLSHDDCKELGFKIETTRARDAIREVRQKLGLPVKEKGVEAE